MRRSHERSYSSSANLACFQHEDATPPPLSNNAISELETEFESLPQPGAAARRTLKAYAFNQEAQANGAELAAPDTQKSDDNAAFRYLIAVGSGSNEPERQVSATQVKRVLIMKLRAKQGMSCFLTKPLLEDAPRLINGIIALPLTSMSRVEKCSTLRAITTVLAASYGTILPSDKINIRKDGQSYMLTIPQLRHMATEMDTSAASDVELLEAASKISLEDCAETASDSSLDNFNGSKNLYEVEQNTAAQNQLQFLVRTSSKFSRDTFTDEERDAAEIILKRIAFEEMGWPISSSDISKPMFEKQADIFFAKNTSDPIAVYYKQIITHFPEAEQWFKDPSFLTQLIIELESTNETSAIGTLSGPAEKFHRLAETGILGSQKLKIDEELDGHYFGERAMEAFASEVRNQLPALRQMSAGKLSSDEIEKALAGLTALNEKTAVLWGALQKQTDLLQPNWKCVPADQIDGRFRGVPAPLNTALDNPIKNKNCKLHANRIDFGNDLKAIASQKPKEAYLDAFWLSAFKEDVSLIVDLTNAKDNSEDPYLTFPYVPSTENPITFDSVEIKLVSSEEKGNGPLQTLAVTDLATGEEKHIQRLCFNQWPDHGVVSTVNLAKLNSTLEHLMHKFNQQPVNVAATGRNQVNKPILIHCRAGVGRTGTVLSFMAANRKLQLQASSGDKITLKKFSEFLTEVVMRGRQDRGASPGVAFVQTPGQFQLLANSLLLSHASQLS